MNGQLTLQSTQHEETKTVPLRRRKACLAGTFALFAACALVLLIPHPAYAGIIGDFLDIPNMIKTWLLQIAATLFNTYFGVINQTLDAKFISGPFNELFGTTEPYGVVKDFYQAGVIPVAHAILGLFMLMQLIKISQRIDATSTLPAVKDIVFLVVTYCILSYFIDNALDLVSAIYGIFNDLVGNVSDKLQSKNWYEPGIEMTKDDAADATFGGCFLLLIFGLISWAVGLVFYAVSMVVALGRSVQLYVYAAFSPIPISLLGFEETKQIGIGYLKNFAAAALAGVVMVLPPFLSPAMVELVGDYHIVGRNAVVTALHSHRCRIGHELQVLRRKPRRNLGKVRHLVVEHVVVGAEQQEPLVRVVLNHLRDDDELPRSRRFDDAGAVALPKHV